MSNFRIVTINGRTRWRVGVVKEVLCGGGVGRAIIKVRGREPFIRGRYDLDAYPRHPKEC